MPAPNPTPILRFIHIDNLDTYIQRDGVHAPNNTPNDGLTFRTNHNHNIQAVRQHQPIGCGPMGTIHDYVPFYFGPLSPMMLNLKTGRVPSYNDGQEPLIYLVTSAQALNDNNIDFVFSDGHGIAAFTRWFDNLGDLQNVDWGVVNQRYWTDNINDMDRQRRKQAEFLAYQFVPWAFIQEIAVYDAQRLQQVEQILDQYPGIHRPLLSIRREWYYN